MMMNIKNCDWVWTSADTKPQSGGTYEVLVWSASGQPSADTAYYNHKLNREWYRSEEAFNNGDSPISSTIIAWKSTDNDQSVDEQQTRDDLFNNISAVIDETIKTAFAVEVLNSNGIYRDDITCGAIAKFATRLSDTLYLKVIETIVGVGPLNGGEINVWLNKLRHNLDYADCDHVDDNIHMHNKE